MEWCHSKLGNDPASCVLVPVNWVIVYPKSDQVSPKKYDSAKQNELPIFIYIVKPGNSLSLALYISLDVNFLQDSVTVYLKKKLK